MQYSVIKKRLAGSVQHMPQINFLGTETMIFLPLLMLVINIYTTYTNKVYNLQSIIIISMMLVIAQLLQYAQVQL